MFECLPIESGTISRYGLVRVAVPLLEEVYCCGADLEGIYAQNTPSVAHSLLCCLWMKMENFQLFLKRHVCLHATIFPAMTMMD